MEPVSQLGRYRLGEQIGAGGMAEVFRGELSGAEGFSRPVAIKRVRARLVGDSETARGFIEEARLAQRLQHGNIVQTYDLGIESGVPYIVMECVDGMSLADVIEHNIKWDRRLGVAVSLYVIEAVAEALDYAHRLSDAEGNSDGVVHRDVNPRNILLSTDGIVKLTDFGIAKGMNMKPRTLPGRVKGTLGYLSPEQAYGGIIGPPTDQFATGVVLYQLLAGHNPLAGATKIKEYRKMLDEGLPPLEAPEVDDELRAIVGRATASKFDARFSSMSEFRQVLEAWRVARGVRTSLDGVRNTVRSYRGHKAPPPHPIAKLAPLDGALLAQLSGEAAARRDTRMIPSQDAAALPQAPRRRRLAIAALAGGCGAAILALVLIMSSGGDESPAGSTEVTDRVEVGAALSRPIEGAADREPVESTVAKGQDEADVFDEAAKDLAERTSAKVSEPAASVETKVGASDAEDKKAIRERQRKQREAKAREEAAAKRAAEARDASEKLTAPALGSGTIRVNVLPYAEVSVDGKARGRTPASLSVSAGTHRVRLYNPGTGKSTTKSIQVGAGETKSIMSW